VSMTVVMRAREGEGGIVLATADVIRPTKTVSASGYTTMEDGGIDVPNGSSRIYTYIIRLERLSAENYQPLESVYDILPPGFTKTGASYVAGSSKLRVDGGAWEAIANPLAENNNDTQGQWRLRWPASGNFASPIKDFGVRQVKELQFQVQGTLPSPSKQCNWVVLKPWNTLSGQQAPIRVGGTTGTCPDSVTVSKTVEPELIQPGVTTPVKYVISIKNNETFTQHPTEIRDWLPQGFTYTGPTSGLTTNNPALSYVVLNDVTRQQLLWTGNWSVAAGATVTLTFWAEASKDVSGSYYNEFLVVAGDPAPKVFSTIGVTTTIWSTVYSWNTGTVLVPYYDSRADADEVVIDANFGLTEGGIAIKSWQVY